jgi:hypothetical protein
VTFLTKSDGSLLPLGTACYRRPPLRLRVERLERRVDILEQLPDRMSAIESQIVLLRNEMQSEFSATRAGDQETRQQMDSRFEVLTKQMVSLSEVLSERMISPFDANERHMRLLHEDLVQRITTMKEGRS